MRLCFALALLFGCEADLEAESVDAAPPTSDGQPDARLSEGEPLDASRRADAREGPSEADCDPLTPCGLHCVDLQNDPNNCGLCARTCVIPEAEAACVAGECRVGRCAEGFHDRDRDPDNGCEAESSCTDGAECETECGSRGVLVCGEPPTCATLPETCNAADDNCDGACDELPGCRTPVHRGFGAGHIYTDDLAQASGGGYRLEARAFFHLYREPVAGMRPVFLCQFPENQRFFLSSDNACGIGRGGRAIGFWSPTPLCGSTPLYYLVGGGPDHFYTVNAGEAANARDSLGFQDNGVAGHVWLAP